MAADFDVRRIRGPSGQTRFVVLIDVRTRITINCPLATLLEAGLNPRGLYVQREVETTRGTRRRLVGRVRAVEGNTLVLDDHDPEIPTLPIADAWLEPRKENLERVVEAIAGPLAEGRRTTSSRLEHNCGSAGNSPSSMASPWPRPSKMWGRRRPASPGARA